MRCFIVLYYFQNHRDNSVNVASAMQFEKDEESKTIKTCCLGALRSTTTFHLTKGFELIFFYPFILPVCVSENVYIVFIFLSQSYLKKKKNEGKFKKK